MKEPKPLRIKSKENDFINLCHLSDWKKCYIGVSNHEEVISIALNKTEVKRVRDWLNKWLDFKESGVKK